MAAPDKGAQVPPELLPPPRFTCSPGLAFGFDRSLPSEGELRLGSLWPLPAMLPKGRREDEEMHAPAPPPRSRNQSLPLHMSFGSFFCLSSTSGYL